MEMEPGKMEPLRPNSLEQAKHILERPIYMVFVGTHFTFLLIVV